MAKRRKLTYDETAYFFEQLSLAIEAGIPVSEGAGIIAGDADDSTVAQVASDAADMLTDEMPLADALEETGAFQKYAVSMVRIGTFSGRLDDVLKGLSAYYEQAADRLRMIRSAVLHPFILLIMMTVVMIILVMKVLPMFSEIFGQFDSSVNEKVTASVETAYITGIVVLILLGAALLIGGITLILSRIPSVRSFMSTFAARFVLTRRMARVFSRAKFANAMNMMISSGIEASMALENVELLVTDKGMLKRISACRNDVVEGKPFPEAVSSAELLPPLYARSLKMAYKSGSLDEAWGKISERCSAEAEAAGENLISFIEPVLIAVMAVLIGAILLTVMLPMMDIMSALG